MRNRIAALALAVTLLSGSGIAVAAQGPPVGTVTPHRHYVNLPDGTLVPAGPDACSNGRSIQFDNFHYNVHRGVPGGNGIISSRGCT